MSAGRYPILIEQGATVDFEIQYKDSTGSPVDLSGYSGRMQIRPTADASTVYLTLSSSYIPGASCLSLSGSRALKPPVSGAIGIYISACDTAAFTFDSAVYDLEIFTPVSGSTCDYVTRLLQGPVRVSKEVTR
jgi:hypothetical protein